MYYSTALSVDGPKAPPPCAKSHPLPGEKCILIPCQTVSDGKPESLSDVPHTRGSQLTYDEFNAFCRTLPAATYVNQWGGSHVWKIGGKVFAIGGWADEEVGVTFKVTDIAYEILRDQPVQRPAPYLASRRMKWIQHYSKPGLSDVDLKDYLRQSHRIVSLGLSKKKQKELELS